MEAAYVKINKPINSTSMGGSLTGLEKILANKIVEISKESVITGMELLDRICDIYALSYTAGYKSINIVELIKQANKEVGAFNTFTQKKHMLEQEYLKLNRALSRPVFWHTYYKVYRFMYPFITKNYKVHGYTWNGNNWV